MRGFHELVARTYPNLRMLRGINYTENDISQCLKASDEGLFGNDVTSLAESEQELLAFIQSNNRGGVRTTLKVLLEKFERKPYGWYYAAVLCTLANLCARGKVEVRVDGNLLEDSDLERALRNSHGHGNVVLEPQIEFTQSQVRGLKEFYEDFFDAPPASGEAKALGKEVGTAFQDLIHQLNPLVAQAAQYPFLTALDPVLEKLKDQSGKPYTWYLTELSRQEDALLDMKESTIDPIRKFMRGSQKEIYDDARKFIQTQEPNFTYVRGDEVTEIKEKLNDPRCFTGNRIQQVKTLVDSLAEKLNQAVEQTRSQAIETLQTMQTRMQSMDEYQKLPAERQAELDKPYSDLIEHLQQQHLIAVINDRLRYFEEQGYQKLLARMVDLATPKPALTPADPTSDEEDDTPPPAPKPRIEYVNVRQVRATYDKAWLADESDVDRYLESMRQALLEEIAKGKRVQV